MLKTTLVMSPMQSLESLKITGTITIRSYPAGTLDYYEELINAGQLDLARELLKDGEIEVCHKNLIVDSSNHGIDILIQYLISGYTGTFNHPLGIAWGEIGTGQTTPSADDTALTTPTNRAPVSYAMDSGLNEAQIQFFFPDATLANQTYYECGTFIDGTSTLNSGYMFNHALFSSGYSKSAGTDTTLEVDYKITNS